MKYQDFGEEYDKNTLKFTWKLKVVNENHRSCRRKCGLLIIRVYTSRIVKAFYGAHKT